MHMHTSSLRHLVLLERTRQIDAWSQGVPFSRHLLRMSHMMLVQQKRVIRWASRPKRLYGFTMI
eukprot:787462-Pleurochrysis_carterae.AAC.2